MEQAENVAILRLLGPHAVSLHALAEQHARLQMQKVHLHSSIFENAKDLPENILQRADDLLTKILQL